MALFDMAGGGGTETAQAPPSEPQDLSGGLAIPWHAALPYIATQALAAGAAGASPNPVLLPDIQRQAFGNLIREQQLHAQTQANQGIMAAQDALAKGDFAGARKALSTPGTLMTPQALALRGQIAQGEYGMQQNQAVGKLLEGTPFGPLVATGHLSAKDALELASKGWQVHNDAYGNVLAVNPLTNQQKMISAGPGAKAGPGEGFVRPNPEGGLTTTIPLPKPLPESLREHLLPSEEQAYQAAVAGGDMDRADAIAGGAQRKYFATKAPEDRKSAAQDLGFSQADISAMEQGSLDPTKSKAITNRLMTQDEIKRAQDLANTKRINLEMDPAAKTFPHWISYADANGDIVPGAASQSTAGVIKALQGKQLFGLTTDQDNRLRMMNNLDGQLAASGTNIPRLFAGVAPGTNLANAVRIKAQEIGGNGVARLQEGVNLDTSAEQIKIMTGSSRGSVRMFEQYMKSGGGTLNGTDTPESALAKLTFAQNAKTNAQQTIVKGKSDLANLDPYTTNPVLKQLDTLRREGHKPVLQVDRQGNWTIVDHQ